MNLKARLDKLEKLQVGQEPKTLKIFEFAIDGNIYDYKTREVYTEQEYLDFQAENPQVEIIRVEYTKDWKADND